MSVVDLTTGSDTGNSSTDNYTGDPTPTVEFTAGLGDTLEIDWDDGRGFVAAGTGTGASQMVTIDQAYPKSSPKTEKTIQVRATKEGVSATEQIEIIFDRETNSPSGQLATDSDSGNSNNDRITNVAQPTITGPAEVGATIEIRLTNGSGPALASTVVNGDGTCEVQLPVRWAMEHIRYRSVRKTLPAILSSRIRQDLPSIRRPRPPVSAGSTTIPARRIRSRRMPRRESSARRRLVPRSNSSSMASRPER